MKKLEKDDKENGMKGRKREVEGLKEKMKKKERELNFEKNETRADWKMVKKKR